MKKLITERELEQHPDGQAFKVSSEMILTPSARDYASRKGIVFEYPTRGGGGSQDSAMDRAIRDAVVAELGHVDPELMLAVRAGLSRGSAAPSVADVRDDASAALMRAAREKDSGSRAVLAAMGVNQVGILSTLTATLSDMGCDIVNVSQTIVEGWFNMVLIVEIESLEAKGLSFEEFRTKLLAEARELGLEAMLMHEDVLQAMHRVTLV